MLSTKLGAALPHQWLQVGVAPFVCSASYVIVRVYVSRRFGPLMMVCVCPVFFLRYDRYGGLVGAIKSRSHAFFVLQHKEICLYSVIEFCLLFYYFHVVLSVSAFIFFVVS